MLSNSSPIAARSHYRRALVAIALCAVALAVGPPASGFGGQPGKIAVIASVVDAGGNPVKDLAPADLDAKFESGGARITNVSSVGAPTQIIVLFDMSSTNARGPQKMLWNAQCVEALAADLGSSANFLILGFSDNVTPLYEGPGDPAAIGKAIEAKGRGGAAALYEVIKFTGEQVAQQGVGDHTVLVVVSDGIDTASRAGERDVIRALGLAGMPLYTCIVMDPAWNESNFSKLNAKPALKRNALARIRQGLSR